METIKKSMIFAYFFILNICALEEMNIRIASFESRYPFHYHLNGKIIGVSEYYANIVEMCLKANITWILDSPCLGSAVDGANYDGIIGKLQRNEAELGYSPSTMRIPLYPVIFGPVSYPFQGLMVSATKKNPEMKRDVMATFQTSFDLDFWILLIIFCSSYLTVLCYVSKRYTQRHGWDVLSNIWCMYRMFIRQFNSCPQISYIKPSIILMIIFCYFVTTVYLSLFTTDLISIPTPDYVDTFKQLVDKQTLYPVFFKEDSYWTQFSEAKSGPYKEVWDFCKKIGKEKCFGGFVDFTKSLELLKDYKNHLNVAIFPDYAIECFFPGVRGLYPDIDMYVAKEQMNPDIYSFIYSRNISEYLRRYMDERLSRLSETGLTKAAFKYATRRAAGMAKTVHLKLGRTYDYDFERFQFQRSDEKKWVPVRIEIIKILNFSFAVGSCFGMISLIFEMIFRQKSDHIFRKIAVKSRDKLGMMIRQALDKIKRDQPAANGWIFFNKIFNRP